MDVHLNPSTLSFESRSAGLQQASSLQQTRDATEAGQVREAFTQFVGETFYAQLLKAMRSSVGKAPYFHGGQAEEIFTSQLDQTLAEQLADKSTDRFMEPLFERQFPHLAAQLQAAENAGTEGDFSSTQVIEAQR